MFSSLTVVAIISIILWVGLFIFYFISSRRHQAIADELEDLEKKVDADG